MAESRESLSEYLARASARKFDHADQADRLALIDVIHGIVDAFMVTTADALTPDNGRSRPPGGRIYDLEHWIDPPGLPPEFESEYDDDFVTARQPSDHEIERFLARRGLSLVAPGTASQVHRARLGRVAANVAGSNLLALEIGVDPVARVSTMAK